MDRGGEIVLDQVTRFLGEFNCIRLVKRMVDGREAGRS
jgi:hypothetical protein